MVMSSNSADDDSRSGFNNSLYDFIESPDTDIMSNCRYIDVDKIHDFLQHDHPLDTVLTIMHINCRSIGKNFNSILELLDIIDSPIAALALTETWLSLDTESLYDIPGFKFISQSRIGK